MIRLFALVAVVGCIGLVAQGDVAVLGGDLPGLPERNGDVNRDGAVDLSDAIYMLQWMYAGGPAPWPLACEPNVNTNGDGEKIHNGDVNASGEVDISDPIFLLQYLYLGGPEPAMLPCEPFVDFHNGDVNGSGSIDVSDPVYLLRHLFWGGAAPVPGCPTEV